MVPKLRIRNAEPARHGSAAAACLLFLSMAATTGRSVPTLVVVAYFGILGAAAILVGLIVWVLAPRISRLMEGVH
jgi:hypothetical protein